ncbi:MAG: ion transporter [Chloroflexi bacterium]|nr:ion transporter [Chloroflexota bacterium]
MQETAARSPGLKGLVEDALLRTNTAPYRFALWIILTGVIVGPLTMAIESIHPLHEDYADFFQTLDAILLALFSIEYAANVWVAPDRRKYILSWWGLIDLLAILPAYLAIILGAGGDLLFLRQLRILRVLRTLRILKLLRIAAERAEVSFARASSRRNTFSVDIQIVAVALVTVISMSGALIHETDGMRVGGPILVQEALDEIKSIKARNGVLPEWAREPIVETYLERDAEGLANPRYMFVHVPMAWWWSVMTLSLTGYGDMFPVTVAGRLVAGVTMIAGMAIFALTTSIVGRTLVTSLFGEKEALDAVRPAIVVVGGSLPPNLTPVEVVARARGEVLDPEDARPDGDLAAGELGVLERSLLNAEVKTEEVLASTEHVAERFVMATTGADSDRSGLVITPESGWLDRFIHKAFQDHHSKLAVIMHRVLAGMVFTSAVMLVLESVEDIFHTYHLLFEVIETIIVIAFTFEYYANWRMAPRKRDHVLGVWGIIDLLSILPTYIFYATHALHVVGLPISLSGGLMLKALRTMRVLRVLRTLKLSKDADARLKATLESPASPFWMDFQIYLIALFIALLTSATLIWNVEFDPDIENSGTPFTNIAISMWWAIVTLCNVGYGDMIPATMLGRIIGGVTSLVGLLLFGVLTSVITKALMGPVFGTETEKPVVEPDVFYFNPSNGTVGSSDTMATSNVDNLLSLGVIDAAEASALRDRLIGAQPEPADAGTAHRTH